MAHAAAVTLGWFLSFSRVKSRNRVFRCAGEPTPAESRQPAQSRLPSVGCLCYHTTRIHRKSRQAKCSAFVATLAQLRYGRVVKNVPRRTYCCSSKNTKTIWVPKIFAKVPFGVVFAVHFLLGRAKGVRPCTREQGTTSLFLRYETKPCSHHRSFGPTASHRRR